MSDINKILNKSLDDIMSESFGKYAKYIIQDRALPDIRDGLKPVQRRILYAMNELKILHDSSYKKSARTVGEVIGKYHPHGDISIYEAMVRMSQEWKNNITLLDMQGNKGSIDGDGPAAMRYTECRLSKYGEYMMKDIKKDTVKFISNFDDSEVEPSILPTLLPNILINGATGIAAGYATNIPPFNFQEVINGIIFRINNPNSTLSEISKIIKGPDFPTGGIIQGKGGIDNIFKTGKGKFFIRAKIEEETTRKDKKIRRLIVKEIPFDTNKSSIVKALDEIRFNNELPGFKEVRDDSDKNGVSIVLEFETDKDIEIIKTFLFKKTQLQISYSANIVLIKDRKPVQVGLLSILDSFIEHANEIIIKSSKYDLDKFLLRKEILEGLIKAISEIDVLVNLIKNSTSKEEAKNKIQDYFKVDERQSEAIVNLRLYVLTSFDTNKLKKEYDDLLISIQEKEKLINSHSHRSEHICSIMSEYLKDFGMSKRRSLIENKVDDLEINTIDIVKEIKGICVVTRDNYIKFIEDNSIEEYDINKFKIKDADIPIDIFKMTTLDYFVCLTNKGRCITIPAYKIKLTKFRENGVHINEIVTIDSTEKTIRAFAINKLTDINSQILISTKNSLIKRMYIRDFNFSKNAKSLQYINLKNNDEVANVCIINSRNNEVISVTEDGFSTKYLIDEIPILGRTASGVKNMNLKNDDKIAFSILTPGDESFLFLVSNRGGKRIHINDIPLTSRGNTGKRIFQQVESNPYNVIWGWIIGGRSNIYLLNEHDKLFEVKVSDIPISDSTTRMSSFSKIDGQIIKVSYLNIFKNFLDQNKGNSFEMFWQNEISVNDLNKNVMDENEIEEKNLFDISDESFKNNKKEFFIDNEENDHNVNSDNKSLNDLEKEANADNIDIYESNNIDISIEFDEVSEETNVDKYLESYDYDNKEKDKNNE